MLDNVDNKLLDIGATEHCLLLRNIADNKIIKSLIKNNDDEIE